MAVSVTSPWPPSVMASSPFSDASIARMTSHSPASIRPSRLPSEGGEAVFRIQHAIQRIAARDLVGSDTSVVVLVVSFQPFVERNRRNLLPGLVLRKTPAVRICRVAVDADHRLHLARESAHPPHPAPVLDVVGRELK